MPNTKYYIAASSDNKQHSTHPAGNFSPAAGPQYRFPPPPVGSREFRSVSIPASGLDSGTGTGQRFVITFAGNDGYLLLAPPAGPINGMVDIETNAKTVVIHGAEFLPDFATERSGAGIPAGNKTVGKVLDIVTTGPNYPEIFILKNKFRTTDDLGNVVWNAGDPINVGGYQDTDVSRWPLVYMEQNWIDDLHGYAANTVGHTDIIKSNSGPVRGFRIARNRWGCSYQFFILFQAFNQTYNAAPGGTNEFFDNQWYSLDNPSGWGEPVANNLYLSTSYASQVSTGHYHGYKFNGTSAGGSFGYGTYVDMTGNTQDANLGDLMSPPVNYGFSLSGNDLVAIAGQPPTGRNNDLDYVSGTIYNGVHPKLNDISTKDRPVMRTETGSKYRIIAKAQIEAIAAPAPSAPASFAASASGSTITLTWADTNSGTAQTVIERSTDSGATWSALTTVAAGINSYSNSGLSAGAYSYRARALIGSNYSVSYTSTASATVAASVVAPTLASPSMTSDGANISFSGGSGYTTLIPQYSSNAGSTWTSIASDTVSPLTFTGLSAGTYSFRALADGSIASNVVTGTVSSGSFSMTALYDFNSLGASGTALSDFSVANSGQFQMVTKGGYGSYTSNAQQRGGRLSLRSTIKSGTEGYGDVVDTTGRFGFNLLLPTTLRCTEGDTLHMIMAIYFDSDFDTHTNTGILKFIRFLADSAGSNYGHIDHHIVNGYGYIEGDTPAASPNWQTGWFYGNESDSSGYVWQSGYGYLQAIRSTRVMPKGQWTIVEFRQKFSSSSTTASRTTWIDGQFAADFTGNTKTYINESGSLVTLNGGACANLGAGHTIDLMRLFTYWNGNAPKDQGFYLDRIGFYRIPSGQSDALPNTDSYGNKFIGLGVI